MGARAGWGGAPEILTISCAPSEMLRMEKLAYSAQRIRKVLWWGIPLYLSMLVLIGWIFFGIFIPSLEELMESAPSVQIVPGSAIAPFGSALLMSVIVVGIMRAIPCPENWVQRAEKVVVGLCLSTVAAIVAVVFIAPFAEGYFLPKLGYNKCTLLQGSPTMWSTDWVKNPDWCVRGKDRAWVHEQAGAAPPK